MIMINLWFEVGVSQRSTSTTQLLQHRYRTWLLRIRLRRLSAGAFFPAFFIAFGAFKCYRRRSESLGGSNGVDDLLQRLQVSVTFLQRSEQLQSLIGGWFRRNCRFQSHKPSHKCRRRGSEILLRVHRIRSPDPGGKSRTPRDVVGGESPEMCGGVVSVLFAFLFHCRWGKRNRGRGIWGFWSSNLILLLLFSWKKMWKL